MGRAHAQPPRARGHRRPGVRVRGRAEDRRARDLPHLPRRRARARRHARQRRGRRGRHAQPAHDRRDPAAHRGRAAAARGARRGLHVAAGLRRAQRAPRRGRPVDVHEPAQLGRGHDPPARPGSSRPSGRCRCGATGSGRPRARVRRPLGGARVAARARLPRQRATSSCCAARTRSSRSAWTGRSAAARWTSRSTAWSSRSTTTSCSGGSGVGRARPALGDRLEVPADHGGHARSTTSMWNVGKFGDLHPFAMLEPVHVGGVTVKLATLHNEEDLARKDIRAGDEVIVLRAGDVIPQVLSPAPHVAERADRPPPAAAARALPGLRHPDRQARGRGVHEVPEPRLPRAPLAAAQALRLARGDGHRRPRREAGRRCFRARAGARRAADFYRLTRRAAGRARGLRPRSRRSNLVAAIEASQRAAVRARAVRARASRRSARSPGATSPSGFARSTRCSRRRRRRSARPRASGRRWRRRIPDQLADPQMRDADRRPRARRACTSRRRGRRPARGRCRADVRADRDAARLRARRRPSGSSPPAAA